MPRCQNLPSVRVVTGTIPRSIKLIALLIASIVSGTDKPTCFPMLTPFLVALVTLSKPPSEMLAIKRSLYLLRSKFAN